jgi:4,5-DOPA dioxygenase extradiol
VHNLRALKPGAPPDDWALSFERWLEDTIEGNAFDRLLAAEAHPAEIRLAHPTLEHLAPLLVAWAAGGQAQPGRRIADGFTYGNLGMSCYAFGDSEGFPV